MKNDDNKVLLEQYATKKLEKLVIEQSFQRSNNINCWTMVW